MTRTKPTEAWHFVREDRRLGYGDGNIVAPGYVYEVSGPVELCRWGLHASVKPLDALKFAPGPIVCRVELSGQIKTAEDKAVATRREVLWMSDATNTLHEFACQVAEQALRDASVDDACCWAAIDAKRKWLAGEITDFELVATRTAAEAAARAAARAATRTAARAAATRRHNALLAGLLGGLAP